MTPEQQGAARERLRASEQEELLEDDEYDGGYHEYSIGDAAHEFIAHAPEDMRLALDALERVEAVVTSLDGIPMLMQIASVIRAALTGAEPK